MSLNAVHMIAYGRVQGVGFRFFVRDQASTYGIKGWVKNLYDGGVEIHAEGEKKILDAFIERVRRGPVFGHVSELTVDWIEPTNSCNNFSIQF